jgi:hypothetical protein
MNMNYFGTNLLGYLPGFWSICILVYIYPKWIAADKNKRAVKIHQPFGSAVFYTQIREVVSWLSNFPIVGSQCSYRGYNMLQQPLPNPRNSQYDSGWWFQTFFIFHNIWDYPSHWLTTNQDCLSTYFCKMNQCSWENLGWRIFSHPNEGDSGPRSSGRRSSIPTACYQALLHPWVWDSSGGAVQNFAKNPVGFPILNWHLRWVPRSCCSGSDSCGRSVCWIPPTDHFPRSYEFLISVKPRLLGHLPSGND